MLIVRSGNNYWSFCVKHKQTKPKNTPRSCLFTDAFFTPLKSCARVRSVSLCVAGARVFIRSAAHTFRAFLFHSTSFYTRMTIPCRTQVRFSFQLRVDRPINKVQRKACVAHWQEITDIDQWGNKRRVLRIMTVVCNRNLRFTCNV